MGAGSTISTFYDCAKLMDLENTENYGNIQEEDINNLEKRNSDYKINLNIGNAVHFNKKNKKLCIPQY